MALLVQEQVGLLLIDDHCHSILAMLSLGAVEPHRSGVVDDNGVCGSLCGISFYWHEAREDTSDGRVRGNRLAWAVKDGLSNSVVCSSSKVELDPISNSSYDVVW